MKVYKIQTIVIVEDNVNNEQIEDLCREIDKTILNEVFLSNHYTIYHYDRTIDYADPPHDEDDNIFNTDVSTKIDGWVNKSQEIIDNNIKIEMRNP